VYNVKKGPGGWKFNRREFLTTAASAAAATAAAVTGVAGILGDAKDLSPEAKAALEKAGKPAVEMLATTIVGVAQQFVQIWRLKNQSETEWTRGAELVLMAAEHFQAPASVAVPDIPPGGTVEVSAQMTAPSQAGTFQCSWGLDVGGQRTPVVSNPLIVSSGCIAESAHPYPIGVDTTPVVITNPDTNAKSTQVHFSQLETEANWDYVIIRNGNGQEIQRITGSYPTGLWSNAIPGKTVQIYIHSDNSINAWGFCVDQVQSVIQVNIYLPVIFKQPTPTPTPRPTNTPCPCIGYVPCGCNGDCGCNGNCTCDTIHYWYPN
jgi:hypothetical protein